MRRVLIITPYFPPTNAADMQRIRMSLPYFKKNGWEAEVVTVDSVYSDLVKDNLLIQSIPTSTVIHLVKALPKKLTARIGLGSIAIRSLWFYKQKVNILLRRKEYDLIYFSTTQFPVCILGAYWKRKFGIPYVIDMQDPWHTEFYKNKPKDQQPRKYWLSYRMNKWLEPIAMKKVSGLISVSQAYIDDLIGRYPHLKNLPSSVIPFGAFQGDLKMAEENADKLLNPINAVPHKINLVYIGRGGHDMQTSFELLFLAMQRGLSLQSKLFKSFHLYFIGTSYAPSGQGLPTVEPLALEMGLQDYITELTDRIGFYDSLATLQMADILFIPGSDDPKYSASKIYPYLTSQKPILAIVNEKSSTATTLKECIPRTRLFTFPGNKDETVTDIYRQLTEWSSRNFKTPCLDQEAFAKHSAEVMTSKQTRLFDKITNE